MVTLGTLLSQEGYELCYASGYQSKVLRLLHMLYKVFVQRKQTDYVLIDTYSSQNFYYAVLVGKLCAVLQLPYIPILHGGNLPERLGRSPQLCKPLFHKALVNVSPSLYLKTAFEARGYPNVVYIPNTLQLESYPFKQRSVETIKLLWVRSFAEIYNPMLAIKVLKGLRDLGYIADLCMVGPDSDGSLEQVQQYSALHNLEVRFTGKLTKDQWIDLSNDYTMFINTAHVDNAPVSVMEAMALGLPIVSTNVGGMPYLIAHGIDGLLVDPDNIEQMAAAILKLYDNDVLAKTIVVNARLKVEQFDWEIVKKQWFEVLG